MNDKTARILAAIQRVPPGHVATYGDVARMARLPGRARLVGTVLRDAPEEWDIPWHRIVNAAGRISPRSDTRSARRQQRLLAAEGVELNPAQRLDLSLYRWNATKTGSSAYKKKRPPSK